MTSLAVNGEVLDDVTLSGRCRTMALHLLCAMHQSKAGYVQMLAVQSCKHPTGSVTGPGRRGVGEVKMDRVGRIGLRVGEVSIRICGWGWQHGAASHHHHRWEHQI